MNDDTIPELHTSIVAGGANNQLLEENRHAAMLREKGVLYAPDYVINAGGLINVYQELQGYDADAARNRAAGIFDTLTDIFKQSDEEGMTTIQASNKIAEDRINGSRKMKDLRNSYDNQLWINN